MGVRVKIKYEGEAHVGYGFNPPELTIEKGTIVKWVNNDSSTHTVYQANPVVVVLVLLLIPHT